MQLEAIKKHNYLYLASTVVLIALFFLPSYRTNFNLVALALLGMAYAILFIKNSIHRLAKIALPLLCYGLIGFIFSLPGNFKMGFLHPIMIVWISVFPMIIANDVIKRKNIGDTKIVYFISLIFLCIILTATIKAMSIDPEVMRYMTAVAVSDKDEIADLTSQNVGGYGVAYGVGAVFISFVGSLLAFNIKGRIKFLSLVSIIAMGFVIIHAQFTTLLILVSLALFIQLIQIKRSFLYRFLVILMVASLWICAEPLFVMIMDFFSDTTTGYHLQEIYGTLFGNEEYDHLRRTLLSRAIDLFLQSPIVGSDVSNPKNMTIAIQCHSTILYNLIRGGIFGLFFFLYTYWLVFKPIFKHFSLRTRNLVLVPLLIYYLVLSYLNPIESDVFNFCFGFIALTTVYIFSLYSKNGKNNKKALAQ